MPIRIAFIVGQLGLGGAEQQLYYLLRGLDRSRFCPLVISLGRDANEYWRQPIAELEIPLWHASPGRFHRIVQIARLLRSEGVRIVHSWDLHTNPYSLVASRLAGVPVRLGSMRFNYDLFADQKLLHWFGYRGLDVVVTNSVAAANQLKELRKTRASVKVLPNGIPVPEAITPMSRVRLKTELGFLADDMLIGSVGRLDGNKNYQMLVRVFASLTETWKALRLIIIGDGPLKIQLQALADRLGLSAKIKFPGSIPLAARYLPAMEVCCMTSYSEGMPNVIMEASAAGLPVVSTSCGGSIELIDHEVSGYLFAPDDDAGMSTHLDRLLAFPELRVRMGKAGRDKMRREYGIHRMIAGMTHIYEEAIATNELKERHSLASPLDHLFKLWLRTHTTKS